MDILSIFILAIGLSMDAFAVSVAKGMTMKKQDILKYALLLGAAFGFFQGSMPFIGWLAGSYFENLIASFDHWIAFALLGVIGLNMIKEAVQGGEAEETSTLTLKTVFILAIATSIDALAVGISFAFLRVNIISACLLIGGTTFVLSFIAVYAGSKLGGILEKYAGMLGGIILIFIGLKILLEHLLG